MIRGTNSKINVDFKAKRQQILDSLDIASEAKRLGLRLVSDQPGQSGWIICHALGRDDATPSAGINVSDPDCERGYYRDHGESVGMSFFDLAVELGEHSDFESAFRHYSQQVEPSGQNHHERPPEQRQAQPKQNREHQSKKEPKQRSGSPGKLTDEYVYRDAEGKEIFKACRFLQSDGKKTFRQMSQQPDGWKHSINGVELVPYNLPEIVERSEERIFIAEGEKDVERLMSEEILATCNPMGAGKWKVEFSKWFTGREIVILSDNDQVGRNHAEDVAAKLHAVAESIQVVHLPGLPEKGDVSDYLDNGNSIADLYAIADETELWEPEETEDDEPGHCIEPPLQYVKAPVHLLPATLRELVEQGSKALDYDPAFLFLQVLVICSACIGSTRRIRLKRNWCPPAILWGMFVGKSSAGKGPTFKVAKAPLEKREHLEIQRGDILSNDYDDAKANYDIEYKKWKNQKAKKANFTEPPPEKPVLEPLKRTLVSNITNEALIQKLSEKPRGLCAYYDEMSQMLGGLNRYHSGSGDEALWINAYNGEAVLYDRKTDNQTIFIGSPFVAIIGGIQPRTFRSEIGDREFGSGFMARFLMIAPPSRKRTWNENELPKAIESSYDALIGQLLELEHRDNDELEENQRFDSVLIYPDGEAKKHFIDYFNRHNKERDGTEDEDVDSMLGKTEETAARIALVLHCVKRAELFLPPEEESRISGETMQEAIAICEWAKRENRRCYQILCGLKEEHESRQLVEWIQARGGTVTARELQRGKRTQYKTSDDAEKTLTALVTGGLGKWETESNPKGGREKHVFRLCDNVTNDTTPKT